MLARCCVALAIFRVAQPNFDGAIQPGGGLAEAGRIPRVSYDGNEINVDGALLFNMFDGTVAATQLKLTDPFGRVPRLSGDLNMRELDLDLLTRTFSFGNMLELQD